MPNPSCCFARCCILWTILVCFLVPLLLDIPAKSKIHGVTLEEKKGLLKHVDFGDQSKKLKLSYYLFEYTFEFLCKEAKPH